MDVMVCLSVLSRLGYNSGIAPVAANGQSKFFGEWAHVLEQQDGAVVGVSWPLLASGPLIVLNAHFRLQLPHPCSAHN